MTGSTVMGRGGVKYAAGAVAVTLLVVAIPKSGFADDRIYITDASTIRISKADTLEKIKDISASLGTTGGDDDGRHLVVDCRGRRFFVSNHDLNFDVFNFSGSSRSVTWGVRLSEPLGMAVLPNGKLLITDEERSSGLYRLKSNLSLDLQTPSSTFDTAEGVAYDAIHDRIFVADEDTDEIDIFNGTTLANIAEITTDFLSDGPYWLAADGSTNRLFVLGDSKRDSKWGIHVFDITSGGDSLTFNQTILGSDGAGANCYKALTVSEPTDRLFAIDFCDDTVAIYNTSTLGLIGTVSSSRAGTQPLMVSAATCATSAPALSPRSLWILALLLMGAGVAVLSRRRLLG